MQAALLCLAERSARCRGETPASGRRSWRQTASQVGCCQRHGFPWPRESPFQQGGEGSTLGRPGAGASAAGVTGLGQAVCVLCAGGATRSCARWPWSRSGAATRPGQRRRTARWCTRAALPAAAGSDRRRAASRKNPQTLGQPRRRGTERGVSPGTGPDPPRITPHRTVGSCLKSMAFAPSH